MKKTQTQKGITLVALVITIIVLLILAVVAIRSVQESGIIEYAKDATKKHEEGKQTEQDRLDGYVDKLEGYFLEGQAKFDKEFESKQEEILDESENLIDNIIPASFQYGDYEYRYNMYWEGEWWENEEQNGWGVRVIDTTKETYGMILTNAFDKPVTTLYCTFQNCASLKKLSDDFTIPNTIISMVSTFDGCSSLTSLPKKITIPNNVIIMNNTFYNCKSLESLADNFTIGNSVTELSHTFYNCTSLKSLPSNFTLPNSLTMLASTFSNCSALTSLPSGFTIPQNVAYLSSAFKGCTLLTGTITVNTTTTNYPVCFEGTTQNIILTTTSDGVTKTYLEGLAGTSTSGNVTVDSSIS